MESLSPLDPRDDLRYSEVTSCDFALLGVRRLEDGFRLDSRRSEEEWLWAAKEDKPDSVLLREAEEDRLVPLSVLLERSVLLDLSPLDEDLVDLRSLCLDDDLVLEGGFRRRLLLLVRRPSDSSPSNLRASSSSTGCSPMDFVFRNDRLDGFLDSAFREGLLLSLSLEADDVTLREE